VADSGGCLGGTSYRSYRSRCHGQTTAVGRPQAERGRLLSARGSTTRSPPRAPARSRQWRPFGGPRTTPPLDTSERACPRGPRGSPCTGGPTTRHPVRFHTSGVVIRFIGMIRDPSYREIEARLSGKSDPELFEECAGDLLRTVHPTLVPIRGGDDAGMDGAIADAGGLPFGAAEGAAESVPGAPEEAYARGYGRGPYSQGPVSLH